MKAAALLALLLWQAASIPAGEPSAARPERMRYERALNVAPGSDAACAVLDAQIFPHAAPSLTDLRVFSAQNGLDSPAREVPYAITLSEAMTGDTEPARVLNLGMEMGTGSGTGSRNPGIAFDLEMPNRAYTGVTLDLDPAIHDFVATAAVMGMDSPGGKATPLGEFTLFDLASQHLSRDTTLPLQESAFHYLHVVLNVSSAPSVAVPGGFTAAMVRGAQVPPSREAQILYTVVAETAAIATVGQVSRAIFEVPARVPVERVAVILAPGFNGNFSRNMRVIATADLPAKGQDEDENDDERVPLSEMVAGDILRVHATEAGREIHAEQLGIPAVLGANLQRSAKIEVAIENGTDQSLPIAAVRLEMRQRKLCFDAPASAGLALTYGDPQLVAPVYGYARLFAASGKAQVATLGPEQLNPGYRPPPEDERSFTQRHPELLWIALLVAICLLGALALKPSRNAVR